MKYTQTVSMKPWEKLAVAFEDRKERKDLLPGLTWDLLADRFNAQLEPGAKKVARGTVRKWGTHRSSGLTRVRLNILEKLLLLPPGWLSESDADEVPEPVNIHGRSVSGEPTSVMHLISVYGGGTANMWHMKASSAEPMEIRLYPGQEDDTFVKVQDGSLTPDIAPSTIIAFKSASEPDDEMMHLIQKKTDPSLYSVRIYDATEDQFVDPRRKLPPEPPESWQVVGIAETIHRPKGLRFPKK